MGDFEKVKELLSQVPQPPERPMPGGVREASLHDFESWLGYSLPEPMREWLALSNGPFVGPGGTYGIGTGRKSLEIKAYLDANPEWRNRKWIPVAGDGCGNLYVLVAQANSAPACL
jgi:cell wall assembly regulator SMI1